MIVTVTMNPAMDKTVDIDQLERGGLNRIKHVELDAGGKGINVSKTISVLGGRSIATGFLAGNTGCAIENVLKEWKIETDFVKVSGETRTNTKVYEETGELTELNEPGPCVFSEDIERLLEKLEGYAGEDTLFVIAGSIPKGVEKDIYYEIIQRVKKKGSKVLLDADGALFEHALEAAPDILKPNSFELEQYGQIDHEPSEQELYEAAKALMEKGAHTIAVSMGKEGALFLMGDYRVKCKGLKVKAHSTVGAGDAMVAALAYAQDQKMTKEETVKLCMAVSAGAVTTLGTKPPSREVIETLLTQVEIERING